MPIELASADYVLAGQTLPGLHASASRDQASKVNLTVCNLHPMAAAELRCTFQGFSARAALGRVLTAPALNSHNTFEKPEVVRPERFDSYRFDAGSLVISLPPRSVVAFR